MSIHQDSALNFPWPGYGSGRGRQRSALAGRSARIVTLAAALAFLIAPLRSRDAEPALLSRRALHAAGERESVLAALRDLEEDFATGKLDSEDHAQMRNELRARAVSLLAAERDAPAPAPAAAPPAVAICPGCAAATAPGARFCSSCGVRLGPSERGAGGAAG